jgi:DNA-binding transcriptional ArsR family regulator
MLDIDSEIVELLKVLGDSTRLGILQYIKNEQQTATVIQKKLNKSQSTISQHLKILLDADLIEYTRKGKKKLYSIKNREILNIIAMIQKFIVEEKKKELEEYSKLDIYDTLL